MKKIMLFIFAVILFSVGVLSFQNFINENENIIYNNHEIIRIDKPDNIGSKEFLQTLSSLMQENQYDLMIKAYSKEKISSNKIIVEIYKTNYSSDFLPFIVDSKTTLLGHDEYFSTIEEDVGAKSIYSYSLECEYRVFPLEKELIYI